MKVQECRASTIETIINDINSTDRPLRELANNQPPRSECAYIGKRALSWAPWIPGISSNKGTLKLDQNNLELSHEHLFLGDKTENIGWGPSGLFIEDPKNFKYQMDGECFDGSLMRKALGVIELNPRYNFIFNNCQTFIQQIRNAYFSLGGK